jgi:predicted lysophospholipase L1 biosynthesis ABC-type transport system permease subunit
MMAVPLSSRIEERMPAPQTYKNHSRFHPPFHFFVAPVLLLNVLVSIAVLVHHWPKHWALLIWLVVMSLALFLLTGLARSYALRVQDRVIRLEERLRYQSLLTPELLAAAQSLTLKQIIALRFASDAELPTLIQRTLSENLKPKDIKQSITNWRADNLRV